MSKMSAVRSPGSSNSQGLEAISAGRSLGADPFNRQNFGEETTVVGSHLKKALSVAASAIDKMLTGKSAEFRNEVIYLLATEKTGTQSLKKLLDRLEIVRDLVSNVDKTQEGDFLRFLKSLNEKKEISNPELRIVSIHAVKALNNFTGEALQRNFSNISEALKQGTLHNLKIENNPEPKHGEARTPPLVRIIRIPVKGETAINVKQIRIAESPKDKDNERPAVEDKKEEVEVKLDEDLEELQRLLNRYFALLKAGSEILKMAESEKAGTGSSSRGSEARGAYEAWYAAIDVLASQLGAKKIGSAVVAGTGLDKMLQQFQKLFGGGSKDKKKDSSLQPVNKQIHG